MNNGRAPPSAKATVTPGYFFFFFFKRFEEAINRKRTENLKKN